MKDIKQVIAANISALRRREHLTQAELAERLNYSDKAVSKWERGDSVPDIAILKQIAELFGVTVDYLLEEEHSSAASSAPTVKKRNMNHSIIPALSVALLWLIAIALSAALWIACPSFTSYWLIFIAAIPATAIVLLVFSCIWGSKLHRVLSVTLLIWSSLLTVYLFLLKYNLWLLFIIGIPGQIIVFLWSRLVFPSKKDSAESK